MASEYVRMISDLNREQGRKNKRERQKDVGT